jgi:tetratricopeptide (TPR) repeat protein
MISFAAKLRADRTFLANKPDLAAVVARIHAVALRKEVEGIERDARTTRDRAAYEKCGEAYLALVAEPGLAPSDAEELRYNAGVCFEEAGSIDRAVATYRQLIKTHPRSRLAGRAVARIARAEAQVAHYREAAEALEQYVERYPGEKDAVDAASDGVLYAVVTGDLSRAARIADLAIARYGAKKPRLTVEATLVVIEAQLAAGKRKEALARARGAATKAVLRRLGDPVFSFRAGRAFAATGCPVALVDELCPKPRDRALVAASRLQLALAGDRAAPRAAHHVSSAVTTPIADHATRLALDLDLEPVLAARRSIAPATDAVARGYEQLIVAARAADVRIAAHARLGTLHRHKGDRDKALLALRACVTEARASSTGSEWLVRCERDLIALRAPDLDILPERLPAPAATPEILVERIR